jgi:hypothetical protein
MNYSKIVALVCIAFVASLMDTSFFSFLPIFGATLLLAYVIALNFALTTRLENLSTYAIPTVFFYSIFSSLPIWLVVLVFFVIPSIVLLIKNKYFPEPSTLSSAIFFVSGTLLFSIILLLYGGDFSLNSMATGIYFTLINSLAGVIMFYLTQKFRKTFSRKDIKF